MQVDLEYLLDRYPAEAEVNWGDELSLGEQQRLGMARLFYHKPSFAILDECTSAVTTDMEERFCAKVRDMGTSCITISHRPALVAFHDIVLALDGEGSAMLHYKGSVSCFSTNLKALFILILVNLKKRALIVLRDSALLLQDSQIKEQGSCTRQHDAMTVRKIFSSGHEVAINRGTYVANKIPTKHSLNLFSFVSRWMHLKKTPTLKQLLEDHPCETPLSLCLWFQG